MSSWVYVGGTFDLFHYGHANFLKRCREYGKVIVALNTDDFTKRYKREPILSLGERIESLEACRWVDDVTVNIGDENSGETIDSIRDKEIAYIAHGSDWQGDDLLRQLGINQEWLDARNIKMLYIPYTQGVSTTDIIGRIRGDVHSSCDCSRQRSRDDSDGCCASCTK
jgi:glycerol-3-phosphate cytidylyltransferase